MVDKEVSLTRYETSDSGQLVTTASGRTVRLKPSGRLSMVTAWVLAGDEVDGALLTGAPAGNPAPASAATPVVGTAGGMGGAVAIAPDGYLGWAGSCHTALMP
jgi:hypothetical protein